MDIQLIQALGTACECRLDEGRLIIDILGDLVIASKCDGGWHIDCHEGAEDFTDYEEFVRRLFSIVRRNERPSKHIQAVCDAVEKELPNHPITITGNTIQVIFGGVGGWFGVRITAITDEIFVYNRFHGSDCSDDTIVGSMRDAIEYVVNC